MTSINVELLWLAATQHALILRERASHLLGDTLMSDDLPG